MDKFLDELSKKFVDAEGRSNEHQFRNRWKRQFSILLQKCNSLVILKKVTKLSCGRAVDSFDDDIHSVLARTGKLPVGAARCQLKVGKQPILPVVLGTSRYCVLIPKTCYYNVMANETKLSAYTRCPSRASSTRCHLTAVFSVASLVGHPRQT